MAVGANDVAFFHLSEQRLQAAVGGEIGDRVYFLLAFSMIELHYKKRILLPAICTRAFPQTTNQLKALFTAALVALKVDCFISLIPTLLGCFLLVSISHGSRVRRVTITPSGKERFAIQRKSAAKTGRILGIGRASVKQGNRRLTQGFSSIARWFIEHPQHCRCCLERQSMSRPVPFL